MTKRGVARMISVITAGLLVLCVFVVGVGIGGLWWRQRRIEMRQEVINRTAREIFAGLYVPDDVTIIGEGEADDLLAYGKGCVGIVIEAAYGTERSFEDILSDYHRTITSSGWHLYPGYGFSLSGDSAFYQMTPPTYLSILKLSPGRDDAIFSISQEVFEQYQTVYLIVFSYTEPSDLACTG